MATFAALTIQGGATPRTQRIHPADVLAVGAGITTESGALTITSATGAVSVGTIGALTTVLGDFQVNGAETIVGGTTFQGNVTIGDGVGIDSLTFNAASGRLGSTALPDVLFSKEAAHLLAVDASTTAATVGGNLTIRAGNGNGNVGGNLFLDAGTGTSNGALSIGATNALQVLLGRAAASSVFTGSSLSLNYSLGVSETRNAIGVTQTSGMQLVNTTAAVAGPAGQQWSPGLMLSGRQFAGVDIPVDWMLQVAPLDGAADSGSLVIKGRNNGGAWNTMITVTDNANNPRLSGGTTIGSYIQFGGTALLLSGQNGFVLPVSDNGQALGLDGVLGWNCVTASWLGTHSGTQLTAANTITPVFSMHHITGATTVKTIAPTNLPTNFNGVLTLIADSALITWDDTGNIAIAGTLAQNLAQDFVWDRVAAKWYPKV